MSKVQDRLADLGAKMDSSAAASRPKRERSVIRDRVAGIEAISQGRQVHVTLHRIAPARIRMWAGHNRDYSALTPESCADIIDGFRRHEQVVPAIGRRLPEEDEHDVELIVGARRHYAAAYLHKDLLVQLKEFDDREAFVIQDLENRDRQDVSNLEQARDYLRALPLYFDDSLKVMADQLQIDRTLLTRLVGLAKLPQVIVDAYADRRELVVHHGTVYRKLMGEPTAKRRVLDAASAMTKEGGAAGKQVLAGLTRAARGSTSRDAPRCVGAASVGSHSKKRLTLNLQLPVNHTPEALARLEADLVRLVREVLTDSRAPTP